MLLQSVAVSSGAPLPWPNALGTLGTAGLTVMVLVRNILFVIFDPRETVEGSPQFPRGSTEGRQIWT